MAPPSLFIQQQAYQAPFVQKTAKQTDVVSGVEEETPADAHISWRAPSFGVWCAVHDVQNGFPYLLFGRTVGVNSITAARWRLRGFPRLLLEKTPERSELDAGTQIAKRQHTSARTRLRRGSTVLGVKV
jgi:hypothetical protein